MPERDLQLEAIADLRKDGGAASAGAHAALIGLESLRRTVERNARGKVIRDRRRQGEGPADADLQRAKRSARERRAEAAAADARLAAAIDAYIRDRSPETLTAELDSTKPVLLLPLRVETRWRDSELLIRVFPDEIAVNTHERLLTDKEKAAGEDYWHALAAAADETARKAAWRKLVQLFGANRAQWVALSTMPTNLGAGGDPEFPEHPALKEDGWTEPPRIRVLPDRLELLLLRGGTVVHHVPGKPIADTVHAGPAPIADEDGNGSWERNDTDGRIDFDAKSAWLKDFAIAEQEGLAFRAALEAGDSGGFDELIVLGIKYSAGPEGSAKLLGELLTSHRYSPKGLALVPQGTATNNTSDEDSGLDPTDWFAEESYKLWTGEAEPAPTGPIDPNEASDAERLAFYLGLPRGLLRGIPNHDAYDHAEAVAMNVALYPATLGFFLRTMLAEVVPDDRLDDVRELFTHWVSGRGPLSALRVGSQPYGMLLAGPPPRDLQQGAPAGRSFSRRVEAILARARPYWEQFVPALPRIGGTADAGKDLLAVLALHPSTIDYYQRVAATHDHLSGLAQFQAGGRLADDAARQLFEGWVADAMLASFGSRPVRPDGTPKPYPLLLQLIHASLPTRIPAAQLIDGLPISEARRIHPYDEASGNNYIDWLAANARNAEALRTEDFGAAKTPTFLLYMMLRHALLIQSSVSANDFLRSHGIDASELVTSRKFVGMTRVPELTAWEILSAPAQSIKAEIVSGLPLISHLHDHAFQTGSGAAVGAPLGELLGAYALLGRLPTARLERLLADHIDTLSYRLDAWETALIDKRIAARRLNEQNAQESSGLYIGAVGYLERVRRPEQPTRTRIAEDVLPEALREDGDNLYAPQHSGGRLHAPSLNHAISGAVLRSGYLSHASAAEPGPLAVNLSSRRVRRSAELLEGLRHGQPLEVLLGIEFERFLHDATTRKASPVILNQLKPAFRAAFPIQRMKTPPAGHPDEKPELRPDYSVVNGLSIAASADGFPDGVAGLGPLDSDQKRELALARNAVRSSLDALKDAITTESAYQLALGNFDRSAALVQAMAQPLVAPELEVIRSSRGTELSFTQRATILFDPAAADAWPGTPGPRAELEPPINAWLVALLPAPGKISCKIDFTDKTGAVTHGSASAADLTLQPIDLLHLGRRAGPTGATGELEARVRDAARAASGAPEAASADILFVEPAAAGDMSFAEALSLLDLVHQFLSGARPLDGRDGLTHGKKLPDGTDPTGLDLAEMKLRVDALIAEFSTHQSAIAGATSNPARELALRAASDAGAEHAYPIPGTGTTEARALAVAAQLQAALDAAAKARSDADALDGAQAAEQLIAAVRALLGSDVAVMPRFSYPDSAEIAACEAAKTSILAFAQGAAPGSAPVDEMLTSIAQVRPAMHRAHRVRLMHEILTDGPLELAALQLPARTNDVWLGAGLPAGHTIYNDTLSLLQFRPQGFSSAGPQCGLLIDEWVEALPRTNEVTGMAFNFDQPNSAPLQTLMLAVSRSGDEGWSWNELIASVRDAIHRARLRGVEPDMLDEVPGLTTLVPATMAEFTTSKGALSLDFGLASSIVISQAAAVGYFEPITVGG